MRKLCCLALLALLNAVLPASARDFMTDQPASPPVAQKREYITEHHGISINDPYAWLRDPDYPTVNDKDVLDHLQAENAWFKARMAAQEPRVDKLFREMRARIKEADKSVPQKDGDYFY